MSAAPRRLACAPGLHPDLGCGAWPLSSPKRGRPRLNVADDLPRNGLEPRLPLLPPPRVRSMVLAMVLVLALATQAPEMRSQVRCALRWAFRRAGRVRIRIGER